MATSSRGRSSQPVVLAPGDVFARDFVVISRLASGGMGTVYVVEQRSTRRQRALKLMHPDLVNDDKSRERFEREATIGSRIDSEHVVEVVAAGVDETSGVPWLAMELLDGMDLAARVARHGAMPRDEVLEAFRQLCHALDAAHRGGIVHRDLKPENVFLARARRSDVRFTVKVLDFGIAKWLREARAATMASQSIGTPYWMAPEQTESRGSIGAAADVWPLGLIAFYLLTGKIYWATAHERDASIGAVIAEIVALPIERPSVRAARLGVGDLVPGGLDEWFVRCVARDPAMRFATAGDALRAIEPVLSAQPAPAATVALAGAVPPPAWRSPDGRTVAAPAPPARPVLGGIPVSISTPTSARRGGAGRWIAVALAVVLLAIAGIAGVAVVTRRRSPSSARTSASNAPTSQLPAPPQLPPAPTPAAPPAPAATPPAPAPPRSFVLVATASPPNRVGIASWQGILLYTFQGHDQPFTPAPGIDASSVRDPAGLAFRRSSSELFVGNRHGNTSADGVAGSISRFRYEPATRTFTPSGSITGNGLSGVHQVAFSSTTGELFAANGGGRISRFTFGPDGSAIANGAIGSGTNM